MNWVYEFGMIQWFAFGLLAGYTILWMIGTKGLVDPFQRWFRIESLDWIYETEWGTFVLFGRNAVIWILLFILFFIVRL